MSVPTAATSHHQKDTLTRARSTKHAGEGESFRPDIEGLRAIAILLVVAFHVEIPGFSGGFIGVDVFFVLSGFLITRLLLKEARATGSVSLASFWARRARRLLPASALMLVVVVLGAALILPPLALPQVARAALATSSYISNFFFAYQSTDYLATGLGSNPLLHHWSLAVEEQFYILWPVLILLATRIRGRADSDTPFWVVSVLVGAGSMLLSLWLTKASQPWAFFGSPARAWEFAAGAVVVLSTGSIERLPAGARIAMGWLGLGLVLLSGGLISRDTAFPGTAALFPVAGTALLLAGGMADPLAGAGRFLSTSPMRWFGKLSYTWYLWHWPALIFAVALVPHGGLGTRLAAAGIALGVSAATHHFVENPIRFNRPLAVRPWRSLALAGVLMMACIGASGWLRQSARERLDQPSQRRFRAAYEDIPVIYQNGCHVGFADTLPANCAFGDTTSSRSIVLFGDSHAAEWFPALDTLGKEYGWRFVPMTKSACPSISVPVFVVRLGREYYECARWRANAIERIRALRPALVLLSNDDLQNVVLGGVRRDVNRDPEASQAWRAGIVETIHRLAMPGLTVGLLRDTPHPVRDIPECLSGHEATPKVCDLVRAETTNPPRARMEEEIAATNPNVVTVDLTDIICGPDHCPAIADGMVTYRDDSHLTGTYVMRLAPVLLARLPGTLTEPPVRTLTGVRASGP